MMLVQGKRAVGVLVALLCFGSTLVGGSREQADAQTVEIRPTFAVNQYIPRVPHSGPISSIAVSPDDRTILVASDTGGVFRSTDGGSSWRHEDELPSSRVEDVEYLGFGAGVACPCWIASTAQDFEANGGGGVYIKYTGSTSWTRIRNSEVFPTTGTARCPMNPSAHEISVAPNGRDIYVATDCGIAAGTAPGPFRPIDIPGAANPRMVSVVALDGGGLIAGGPNGVWYTADVTAATPAWARGTGVTSVAPQDIHALARDARGGRRAYVVDPAGNPFRTFDGGASWQAIPAPTRDPRLPCGGIAHMRMAAEGQVLRLYLGNQCDTKVATVNPADDSVSPWTRLVPGHEDTRHVAFRSGTNALWLISSDGGLHETLDGTLFRYIGGPAAGLNADQVVEIAGQYLPGERHPAVYFPTWHNSIWAMPPSPPGARPAPMGSTAPEGLGLGVARRIAAGARNDVTYMACWACRTEIHNRRFAGDPRPWTGPPSGNIGLPTLVAPGQYAQSTMPAGGSFVYWFNPGLGVEEWRRIATFRPGEILSGLPPVVGPASNPSLIQPVAVGTFPNRQRQVHLARLDNITRATGADLTYPRMNNFGSLGVTPANMPTYDVLGVDPSDPARMIAPDVTNGDVRMSIDGGDSWKPIPGLTELVTQSGALQFSQPYGVRMASLVSTVSFCPDNGSRVLIGTRQGGAYFSFDGGSTWSRVSGSTPITWATSIFWLEGCRSALISTFGRGIFRLDMGIRTHTVYPPFRCDDERICHLVEQVRRAINAARAQDAPGIIVSDGWIRSIEDKGRVTVVTVSPGSVVTRVLGVAEGVRIVEGDRLTDQRRYLQAAFFLDGEVVASARGRAPLRLAPLENDEIGEGLPEPNVDTLADIWVDAPLTLSGAPFLVEAAGPLVVRGTADESIADPMELAVDDKVVATFDPGTKSIDYTDDETTWPLGHHTVTLSLRKGEETVAIASTWFVVPNSDQRKERAEELGEYRYELRTPRHPGGRAVWEDLVSTLS